MVGVRRPWTPALMAVVVLAVAACQSGPADVASGDYRAFAASSEIGAVPPVTLTVDGTALTFGELDMLNARELGQGGEEVVVCPPDVRGVPASLGEPFSLGSTTFEDPAIVGDCGVTSPRRVTVVDLASADGSVAPFPFTRWVEFCDTTDPDCI